MLDIRENVPLAALTTFGIGGSARYFTDVQTEDDIREALAWAKKKNTTHIILAGKSNVLIPDEGLDALVIHIVGKGFSFEGDTLTADSGCSLLLLIQEAGKRGLGGWEKLAGIPGTIGGAVRGNAGAFGPEIKDFVQTVHALDMEKGDIREFSNAECDFSYRYSFFKKNPQWVIVRVQLRLSPVDTLESARIQKETIEEREKRHIQNVQAAGSFFVNPVVPKEIQELFEKEKGARSREGRVPAGWLIETAGLKGARVNDAVASEQHPNYLKNEGRASAKDVLALAAMIKKSVKEKLGVELEEEAVILSP